MNRIGKYFILIGTLLIAISIFLFINNHYEEYEAGEKSEYVVSNIKVNLNNNIQNISNIQEDKEISTMNIDGNNYIGIITIPSLNLELPIMSEYTEENLKIAPVVYYGSIETNDLVICAHSYKTHFKYLSKLKQKDIIIVTDITGTNYVYEVLETEILSPKEVSKMLDSEFDLTLYTCTNDGLGRITIRCNKINEL